MATQKPRMTTEALQKLAAAEYKRAHAQVLSRINDPIAAHFERADATKLDAEAQAALATPAPLPVVRGGGEAILTRYPDQADDRVADWFVDTLQTPDLVKATASLERLRLLMDVGCVELAQDAAETIQPQNSLERMLAGQLAAAHSMAMKFLAKSEARLNNAPSWQQQEPMMETCRLATTATRFMSVFQEGLLTLAKLRTGGRPVRSRVRQVITRSAFPMTTGGCMDVRPSTRAVFEELRALGNVPSVRKMYAKLKGSYPLLVHELQALREEAAAGRPPLPDELAPVEEERDGVLLAVTPKAADALETTRQTLRENPWLYHDSPSSRPEQSSRAVVPEPPLAAAAPAGGRGAEAPRAGGTA
jgi:hypothetical protein